MIGDRKNGIGLHAARAAAAAAAAGLLLAGCSPQPEGSPATAESATVVTGPAAEEPPATAAPAPPASPAERAAEAVRQVLSELAAAAPQPNREQMQQAYAQAGMPVEATEVSLYKTPTGLDVDAIEAAAPVDGQCVVGQVREGSVTVTLLPVLASGRCFVGDQH